MSWFDSTGIASITKNALKEVQKKIDKALDIPEESKIHSSGKQKIDSAATSASVWGSFTGSFFENTAQVSPAAAPSKAIVETQPPRSLSGVPIENPPSVEQKSTSDMAGDSHGVMANTTKKTDSAIVVGWTEWDSSTMEVTHGSLMAEGDQKRSQFTEVSLLTEILDKDGFASNSLLAVSPDETCHESTLVTSRQTEQTPVCQGSANDDSESEFSIKSDQYPDLISPDILAGLSSDCLSPCVSEVSPCITETSPSVTEASHCTTETSPCVTETPSATDFSIKDLELPAENLICFEGPCLKDAQIPADKSSNNSSRSLENDSQTEIVQSPSEESSTEPLSESVEIISSDSVEQSSSIEIISSFTSSGVASPEEMQATDARVGTDQRSAYQVVPLQGDTPAITKQPTPSVAVWPKYCEEDMGSSQETQSVYASFAEDGSACESIHSTSTSSTHTVLDAFPSLALDFSEGMIDSEICESREMEDDVTQTRTASDDSQLTASTEDSKRKLMEEKEIEIENLIEEALQYTKEGNRSESSESQGASSSPDRETPPSDRSKRPKAHSEYTSGHSSTDEVETAASSDIEIISSPSLDGSNGSSRMVPMPTPPGVAAKVWLSAQKGLRAFMPERVEPVSTMAEETISSSLTTSFTSISESSGDSPQTPGMERLSIQVGKITQALQELNTNKNGHKRTVSNVSSYSESSSDATGHDLDKLIKRLAQVNEIVDAREAKVLELSHLNSTLTEANYRLKSRLAEVESITTGTDSNEAVREECTQRLALMERKFQKALKEKESLSKIVEAHKEVTANQLTVTELEKQLEGKEVTIRELRSEGEKLSKQQLNYSNTLKKLRAKEKETEVVLKEQNNKLERNSVDLDRLHKQLGAKEELEWKQIDAIRQLKVVNQKQEYDLKEAIADKDETDGKFRALKEALDTAYREIADLQKTIAANDAEAQQEALTKEIDSRQAMETSLNDIKRQSHLEQQSFLAQIHELQDSVRSSEEQANRKERQLKNDISDLQKRLSESEDRNKEMADNVAAATRPLLRQLDNLHTSQRAQIESWETMEETLEEKLRQAQKSASTSMEKERAMKEEHSDAISELTNLQTKVTELELVQNKLEAELKKAKGKLDEVDDVRTKESNQLEALRRSFMEEMKSARCELDVVRSQFDMEKAALAAEKRKCIGLQEQLKERDRGIAQLQAAASSRASADSSPTPSVSRVSVSGSNNGSTYSSNWMDEVFSSNIPPSRGTSLYDSLRGNSAMTMDYMTSTLNQREGELRHVQSELARSEAQKSSLGKEMLEMTQKIEELTMAVEENKRLQVKLQHTSMRYDTLLQMYGEKVEQMEELTLDLAEVKEMYKTQIEQLLKNE